MMCANKAISKLIKLAFLIPAVSFADINSYQNSQAQAIQNATARFDMNRIQEQQEQTNQDNTLAARIYDVTGIPSWRSLSFIRSSRTPNGVNAHALIDQLDEYLVQNKHNILSNTQKTYIYNSSKYISK